MTSRPWRVFASLVVTALAIGSIPPAQTGLKARATIQLVIGGLVNPRGLSFGPDGALYVAEAGSGGGSPCYTNGAGTSVCYGPTGAVTKITLGDTATKRRVVAGLPSVAPPAGAPNAGAGATGPHDVEFQGLGNGYVTIGLGTDPLNRTVKGAFPAFASVGMEFGRLVRFQPNGKWGFQEDLAGFEASANPDGNLPDSNPYGLLALPSRQVFTDAGGNSLNAVAANGKITNLAVFPNRILPGGSAPGMQAVPTGVTLGPDGDFYLGQLTGGPFPLGGANVYRVPAAGGPPVVYASGFTKIIDLAFGADGSLYVLQISASGGAPPQGTPALPLLTYRGSLLRVPPGGGTGTTVVAVGDGLVNPGGIAIADDGSIYVSNFSIQPGGVGTVVKITP